MEDAKVIKAKKLIEKLKEAYDFYYDVSRSMPYDIDVTLRETAMCFQNCLDLINRLKADNERLESLYEKIGIANDAKFELICVLQEDLETAKSEAYKEFAERLNKRMGFCDLPNVVVRGHIDNLLKEMGCENA